MVIRCNPVFLRFVRFYSSALHLPLRVFRDLCNGANLPTPVESSGKESYAIWTVADAT
jgi:hypothetical protein